MDLDEVLTRGVEQILPDKKGLADLMSKRKIKLYQGFDPSMPSLHLGNLVGLMKLRQFQKLGHEVIFLIGDFTGMIGDPTDKSSTRPKLTREKVLENAKSWKEQAGRVLDFEGENPVKIKFNSEWNDKLSFSDIIDLASKTTYAQIIERDMFQKRIKEDKDIWLHEFLYPLIQGYDSVYMDVDLEIGGSDQLFNMMVGRRLMKTLKNKEKYVLTTKLLVDKEGNKVGKTTGNALFLDSTPKDFYGGVMSFPDETIKLGFELLTEAPLEGLEVAIKKNPMNEKKRLAFEIVKFLWGETNAKRAQEAFEKTVQGGSAPSQMKEMKVKERELPLLDLLFLTNTVPSRSEAKRLIQQGAIDIDGSTINDPLSEIEILPDGTIMKVGKSEWVRILTAPKKK